MSSNERKQNPMPGKISHITAPAAILKLKDINLREKLLLSLTASFNGNGLRAGNEELASLLDIRSDRVSTLLASLERKGYVQIEGRQSKYRAVHFRPNSKVGAELLMTKTKSKNALLMDLVGSTFDESQNINKKVSKRSMRKQFTPPTAAQVKEYAESRGYPNFDAEKFIAYYAAADWHDSKGNAVRNWKQKMLSVWLKGKNKSEPKRGDPDWLPSEKELDDIYAQC